MKKRFKKKEDYDFDFYYLLKVEYEKMRKMYNYFKNSKISSTDKNTASRIFLCMRVLDLLLKDDYKDVKVNFRNEERFLAKPLIEMIKSGEVNKFYNEILYAEKLNHLYYLIREISTRTWWN
jgi:hypothetical protein